ncbi:MAG TPA: S-adenosylmethionine:tRNA ribosyltransferase-isomerase, partial [Gemmatimonadales bacterium]|nr:S-adenosylmethionine:tRNA ribosyltransferase-isomerase [Gemmatimonadales bacterium]
MSLRTADFDYDLPPGLIAQEPTPTRGESRLLVVGRELGDRMFRDLVDLIPAGDLLVLNTTKVRHARFIGTRASGAPAEVLLIHPAQEGRWI